MKIGVSLFSNNAGDLDRFLTLESGQGEPIGDGVDDLIYEDELRFGELVEPLGFDSLWTVEHHFTPYTMVNDPLQFLTYWAARTERIGLGTMVTVLPWHNPVRVAEQIVMLQHLAGDGRDLMIGFGRGASRREYGGLNIDMTKSRELFDEGVQIVKGLLSNERFAFQGRHYQVPDVSQRPESPSISIRPRPRDAKALLDNLYVAWGSPQSVQATGHLGLKPLIIPQRGLQDYTGELEEFNSLRVAAGFPPARATIHLHIICTETADEAQDLMQYERAYGRTAMANYEWANTAYKDIGGYDYYQALGERLTQATSKDGEMLPEDTDLATRLGFGDEAPIGTPDKVLKAIERTCEWLHGEQIMAVFKMGGMPYDVAEKSLRLFAKEVLPAVHEMKPLDPITGTAEERAS
jgi:alkanesulfonate monooxygenase SsuD/methylene tetrahydromethanopterin reductase-like flavin-dependent oxidoreductase (luciferase family)